MKRRFIFGIATIFVNLFWVVPISAAMIGGDYNIPMDGFSVTVGGISRGADYTLEETSGDFGAQRATGGNIELIGGFTGATWQTLSASLSKSSVSLSFGDNPLSVVASDSVVLTVTTDSLTGYATSVSESGNFASGANDINDVSDGSVTAGSEEYGIRTSGSDGQLGSDTAISGSVVAASALIPASSSQTTITFSAAVSQSTKSGTYSHTVTFTTTANP